MKRKRDKLRNRRNTLFRKAYELGKSDDIDVAIIVFQKGRYFTYRSLDKESFPPPMSQIVSRVRRLGSSTADFSSIIGIRVQKIYFLAT
jgi:hypothetical protein